MVHNFLLVFLHQVVNFGMTDIILFTNPVSSRLLLDIQCYVKEIANSVLEVNQLQRRQHEKTSPNSR